MKKSFFVCAALAVWMYSANASAPSDAGIITQIIETARTRGVDPVLALSIADIESAFKVEAQRYEPHLDTFSVGVFQILHTTAKHEFGFKGTVQQLKQPALNIRLGVKYLGRCLEKGKGLEWIACCYQSGLYQKKELCPRIQRVAKYHKKLQTRMEFWEPLVASRDALKGYEPDALE